MTGWHKRFRRYLAAAAAIALAGCAARSAGSDHAKPTKPTLRPAVIESVQMVSARDGWALIWLGNPDIDAPEGLEPAVTTDGGRTWLPVPPAGTRQVLSDDTLVTLSPAGAQRAWLFVGGTGAHSSPHSGQTDVFGTSNGGRSWQRLTVLPVGQVTAVDFLDSAHGWLLESLGAAMEQNPVRLYQTTDGGMRWSLLAKSASSALAAPDRSGLPYFCDKWGLSFGSPGSGWITGDCNELAVWVSSDGGRHWRLQRLPLPASTCQADGCFIAPPQFVGRTGFLAIDEPPTQALLLVTSNGGGSWRHMRLPNVGQSQVKFFSATSGIEMPVRGGPVSYVTADGGQRWTAVPQGERLGSGADTSFDFVSTSTGLAWTNAANAPGGTAPTMYQTSDSGRTWRGFTPWLR